MNTFNYFLSTLFYIAINDLLNIFVFPLENDIPLDNFEIIKSLTTFKLSIFSAFFILLLFKHKPYKLIENIYIAVIYIKYASLFYYHNHFNQKEEYIKRVLMWLFTTPAMLSMLAKVNNLEFSDYKNKIKDYGLIPSSVLYTILGATRLFFFFYILFYFGNLKFLQD